MVAISHMWPLCPWHVAGYQWNEIFNFTELILITLELNFRTYT